MIITDVKTEWMDKPLNLPNPFPRFSWKYEGGSYTQKWYRILVSEDGNALKENKAELWDSGIVKSNKTVGIVYGGKPLQSEMRCYLKVITDVGESEITYFETGLLFQNDFKALWVSAQLTRTGGGLYFRKDFYVSEDKQVVRARAYVAGLGCHEFYVNGEKIGEGIMNPCISEYTKRVYFNVYPFEDKLYKGNNTLGIILGHGWLGARKLLAQIHIYYADGSKDVFGTANCADWWVTGSPIVSDSIYDGEVYDGRINKKLADWCKPNCEDGWSGGWLYTMLCEAPSGKLVPQILEPIKVVQSYKPVSVKKVGGVTVYDFGQNFAGFASVTVKGKCGAKVTLYYGEQLCEDGRVNRLNLRTALARDEYILAGDGAENYCPRFTYHGFRYAEAHISGVAEILSVEGKFIRSGLERTSEFECDDEMLNTLHKNAVITEGSNLHGLMTDCPQRDERFGWLNDLSSRIFQASLSYGMEHMIDKVVADITDTQDELGRIADTAPFFTGFRPADPVSVSYLTFGKTSKRFYGDMGVLEENYPHYKKWVDYLTDMVGEDGATLYARYADWCPPEKFDGSEDPASRITPGDFVSIVFYYLHLITLKDIALSIGEYKDADYYGNTAIKTREAIIKKYYDEKANIFASGSDACQALALGLELTEGEKAEDTARKLNDRIVANGYHAIVGNQSYIYLFKALTKYGYGETVRKVLVNTEYPGWGYMVANGATTVWERWEKVMQLKMHSFNHPMFASYEAWLINEVAGINIADDAFGADKIIIKPYFIKGLNFARGKLKTVNGDIKTEWKREGNKITLKLQLPSNTESYIEIDGITKINGEFFSGKNLKISGGGEFLIDITSSEE